MASPGILCSYFLFQRRVIPTRHQVEVVKYPKVPKYPKVSFIQYHNWKGYLKIQGAKYNLAHSPGEAIKHSFWHMDIKKKEKSPQLYNVRQTESLCHAHL